MKKVQTLVKEYNLNSDVQYYEMVYTSYINGQKKQAKDKFLAMKREDRKNCFRYLYEIYNLSLISSYRHTISHFLFNLI